MKRAKVAELDPLRVGLIGAGFISDYHSGCAQMVFAFALFLAFCRGTWLETPVTDPIMLLQEAIDSHFGTIPCGDMRAVLAPKGI